MPPTKLSTATARAVALDAQGLVRPTSPSLRGHRTAFERIGLLQLDTVSVFERSHYAVAAQRTSWGPVSDLDRLTHHGHSERTLGPVTEAWAHEAALVPVVDLPLFEHRQRAFSQKRAEYFREQESLTTELLAQLRDRGPLTVSEIEHEQNVRTGGGWWNKNDVHRLMHALFRSGQLAVTGRRRFERVFDLADRVLPDAPELPRNAQILELMRRASVHLGVGTLDDLRDYYRLPYLAEAKQALASLLERGDVTEVAVDGWDKPAYLAAGQRMARSSDVDALLTPFDPIVWHRPRAARLWDFEYRISIYTPEAQRTHGYYVMPVMIGGELVGRVDLKRDRRADALLLRHANIEPSHAGRQGELTPRLLALLERAAQWQGLSQMHTADAVGSWSLL